MKKAFLLFAIFCSLLQEGKLQNLYSRKQVFLDKLEKNIKSYSALKQLLSEYTTFDRRFEYTASNFFNTAAFYNSILDGLQVLIYHEGDKTVYVSVVQEGGWHAVSKKSLPDDTLFRYVDSSFTEPILKEYNLTNNTAFTWKDIFEDKITRLTVDPGMPMSTRKVKTVWDDRYVPHVKKRDHDFILTECRSFNPVRRAYGAIALYALEKEGVDLSAEENKLLESISHSKTVLYFVQGCEGYRDKPTDEAFKSCIEWLYDNE